MTDRPTALPLAAPRIALPWIVRLRYGLALGQAATVLAVDRLLGIDLPLEWILIFPTLTLASNLWLSRWGSQSDAVEGGDASGILAGIFVLDTLCLTGIMMLSGGPNNPFSLLYLVAITLSATILSKRQTWALGGLATVCFGSLFWIYWPIPVLEMHRTQPGPNLHLIGMWVGFGVAAFLVAMFSGNISELLREREASLIRLQEELSKKDRLASLVTLAAGAAHELSTPLATIAVVAKEVERYAAQQADEESEAVDSLAEDSRLIRTEVERCRQILTRMSMEGAEPAGEASVEVEVSDLLSTTLAEFGPSNRIRTKIAEGAEGATLVIPRRAVEQALVALIRNAVDASANRAMVTVSATVDGSLLQLLVEDAGAGMAEETLRHVGEPFFTTKEPGKGMGLGVFLVRTLAHRLGGGLTFESAVGRGTRVTLELPLP
ncbi:MAG: ATP-binding protein [Acidobacteria bacterium]|nr:ATP-binding protein [Acidobacteriota bacterium]